MAREERERRQRFEEGILLFLLIIWGNHLANNFAAGLRVHDGVHFDRCGDVLRSGGIVSALTCRILSRHGHYCVTCSV